MTITTMKTCHDALQIACLVGNGLKLVVTPKVEIRLLDAHQYIETKHLCVEGTISTPSLLIIDFLHRLTKNIADVLNPIFKAILLTI